MVRSAWRAFACLQGAIFSFATLGSATVHIPGTSAGVNQETGERPLRRDLTEFQNSGAPFDLYVQALQQFQADARDDVVSFFQIAGIHGYPFSAWDGVQGDRQAGYCSHGSTLFPLWHRPFLAVLEATINKIAQVIASKYPESQRAEYVDAAEKLRIPYWDWASNPELPEAVVTKDITINTPEGSKTMPNPLYSYELKPSPEAGFPSDAKLSSYQWTVRSPDDQGNSQIDATQGFLRQAGAGLRMNTYQLLSAEPNYTVMSTDSLQDRGENYNSLEALHNIIHGSVGGYGGHMTLISWSAYDPAFWLHHANVDRIFAMWQAIYPDSYVIPLPNSSGDFVKEPGTMEDVNTPLKPFHVDDETYHTATSVRPISAFGYSYPEVEDWKYNKEDLASHVRQKANELYNSPQQGARKHKHKRSHSHHVNAQQKRGDNLLAPLDDILGNMGEFLKAIGDIGTTTLEKFAELGLNNLSKQWVANVMVDGSAHPDPFSIFFFLGEPPKDAGSYSTSPNLVGKYTTNMQKPYTTYSQVPLSHALAMLKSKSLLSSLESEVVLPLISKHLTWRAVSNADGSLITPADFITGSGKPALSVTIASRAVQPLTEAISDLFPTVGSWETHDVDVVKGYKGGNQDYKGGNQDYKGGNQDYKGGNQDYKGGNQDYKGDNQGGDY